MQGVHIREAVALVDEPSGKVEQISCLQHDFQNGLPNLSLVKVCWKYKNTTIKTSRIYCFVLLYLVYLRLESTGKTSSSDLKGSYNTTLNKSCLFQCNVCISSYFVSSHLGL